VPDIDKFNDKILDTWGEVVTWIVDAVETEGRAIIPWNEAEDDLATSRVRKRHKEFRIRAIESEIDSLELKPTAQVRLPDGVEYDIYSPVESNRYGMAYIRIRSA